MNRRDFLQCAAIIVGSAGIVPAGLALTTEQRSYLAAAPNYTARNIRFFSTIERAVVTAICEIIIPRTDTPGATDAGVARFVELMVADWFDDQERAIFSSGLKTLVAASMAEFGHSFERLESRQQLALLESLEKDASDSPWFDFGNTLRDFISDAPFICQIKELTIWGFFTSKVGGTQVLRYEPMPMRFSGNEPLDPDASSWMARLP